MHSIRQRFTPFQPTIDHSNQNGVSYEEVAPAADLRDFIYCYWQLKTQQKLSSPYKYRVVSDGCIDILFEQSSPRQIFITGFSPKYLEYNLSPSFDYIGVRFLPMGYPTLFGTSAEELTGQFIALENNNPMINDVMLKHLLAPMNLSTAKEAFDIAFSSCLQHTPAPEMDSRFASAVEEILKTQGHLSIADLDVGLSERQLRRLFRFYFGESGKVFAKIVRFQNILAAKPTKNSLKQQKIYYDVGYHDQAHFIKEFKAFYGVTPSRAFG